MADQPPAHGLAGNQNATKANATKVTGKGRFIADLGETKTRLVRYAQSKNITLKTAALEILEEALDKKGF
jgi:hypothetical protein